jgi:hypothetical protein
MGFIRNMVVLALGVLAFKMVKRAMTDLEAAQEKARVKAKAPNSDAAMKTLKLDPITGVYTPEA